MSAKPPGEFGRRGPVAIETVTPVKRSRHVALLLMGTVAIGGGAYALMPSENCWPDRPGMAPDLQNSIECPPRGSSSGGGHGTTGGRSSFFSGDSPSTRSPPATPSDAGSGGVTRGGFGAFARAFASHFSAGG
jgi:hypothetical protein